MLNTLRVLQLVEPSDQLLLKCLFLVILFEAFVDVNKKPAVEGLLNI
jgi:hypothetical protein